MDSCRSPDFIAERRSPPQKLSRSLPRHRRRSRDQPARTRPCAAPPIRPRAGRAARRNPPWLPRRRPPPPPQQIKIQFFRERPALGRPAPVAIRLAPCPSQPILPSKSAGQRRRRSAPWRCAGGARRRPPPPSPAEKIQSTAYGSSILPFCPKGAGTFRRLLNRFLRYHRRSGLTTGFDLFLAPARSTSAAKMVLPLRAPLVPDP